MRFLPAASDPVPPRTAPPQLGLPSRLFCIFDARPPAHLPSRNLFDSLDLEESLHDKLLDALSGLHYQWSLDAFVFISGGRIGAQVEVSPQALLDLLGASVADITAE